MEDHGYGKNNNGMFSIYLKLKFSSNVIPRFKTEAAGVILRFRIFVGKKPSSFALCVVVPMIGNLVLSALIYI